MSEEEKVLPVYKSEERIEFEEQRKDWSNRDRQIEMLYALQTLVDEQRDIDKGMRILVDTTDKVRGNTNTMIWWLVAIPMAMGVIASIVFR